MALTQDKRNLFFGVGALLAVMALFQLVSYSLLIPSQDFPQEHKVQQHILRRPYFPINATLENRLARCKNAVCTFMDVTIKSRYAGQIVFLLNHSKKVELISVANELEEKDFLLNLALPIRANLPETSFSSAFEHDWSEVLTYIPSLRPEVRPKTTENFRALCTGEKGVSSKGTTLHYKGTTFSRIVHNILVQGGDIHKGKALEEEQESVNGGAFDPESHDDELHERGLVAMAGRVRTGSEFFITLDSVAELDNQYVVFGEVVDGMDVVDKINTVELNDHGELTAPILISNSGQL